MERIYLDHNATSSLDPEVLEAMRPWWLVVGNPESRHGHGRAVRRALDGARQSIARVLNAHEDEILFTSGGTESNNLAILGLAAARRDAGAPPRITTTPIEHPAVAGPVERFQRLGYEVDRAPVASDGLVCAHEMARLASGSALATLILAQNETGVIQPVGELSAQLAELDPRVPVHTDAVQAVGRIEVDFHELGVATLAASAHKFHGPVGVGLLLVRRGTRIEPIVAGGGQQGGLRPGTPAVALAVGLAAALELWHRNRRERQERWRALRDHLETRLRAGLGEEAIVRTGPDDPTLRLPQTLHVAFPGRDGDALLMQLDLAGVSASLGSACASGTTQPSPALVAMGLPTDSLRSAVRFSLGAATTIEEIDEAAARIVEGIRRIPVRARPEQ